jgi:FkbM family methyltransferase
MTRKNFLDSIIECLDKKSIKSPISNSYLEDFYKIIRIPNKSLKSKNIAILSLDRGLIKKFEETFPDVSFIDTKEFLSSEDHVDLCIVSDFFSAFEDEVCIRLSKLLAIKSKRCIFAMSVSSRKSKPDRPRQLLKLIYIIQDNWAAINANFLKKSAYVYAKRRKKNNLVFPSRDRHFDRSKDRYQYHVLCMALDSLRDRGLAIDIGGHIGFYAIAMSEIFDYVVSFEPYAENYKCLHANTLKFHNISALNIALSDKSEMLDAIIDPDNSGNTVLKKGREIQAKTLDEFNFKKVSLIKIDVQGFEGKVLKGAYNTIRRSQPILIVELIADAGSRPNKKALDYLKNKLGYKLLFRYGKDFIMGPK